MTARDAVNLASVLGQRLLIVPDYQRPYAWEKKQLADLWADLDLMGEGTKHYTGTLVLMDQAAEHMTSSGVTLQEAHVVDGQQRLTTCLLLLDRIRRALLGVTPTSGDLNETAQEIRRTYGLVAIEGVTKPRLALAKDLKDFWARHILDDLQVSQGELNEGERRLLNAAGYFDDKIAELLNGHHAEQQERLLRRLLARVTSGLRFLVYEVDSAADAGVIFETLNGRGRELSELDKIKNYLLFLARRLPSAQAEHLAERINSSWSTIYERLAGTGADEDLLLRAHWLTTINPDQRSWKGAQSIKTHFSRERYVPDAAKLSTTTEAKGAIEDRHTELIESVTAYVDTLALCAHFTRELVDPRASFLAFGDNAASIRSRTGALRRSGVTAIFRPLLFAARLRHEQDAHLYLRLTELCERYSARVFTIAQRRSNAGQSRLYYLAHDMYAGEQPQQVLEKLEALVWEFADDDQVRAGLAPKQNWYGRRGHKFFLYEYELDKARREEDVADFATFYGQRAKRTTEHVLPQEPNWDKGEWAEVSRDDHARLVHSIGNLALTYDNSSYGRKPFGAKKGMQGQKDSPCYTESSLAQERELATHATWTATTIEERGAQLTEWALRHWPITPPNLHDPELAGTEDDDAGQLPDEDTPESRAEATTEDESTEPIPAQEP